MKIIITMLLSATCIVASSGITAEEGLMRAIGKIDHNPKPLIFVISKDRSASKHHIRELHGDTRVSSRALKREQRLAEFKAKLRKQKQERLLGLSRAKFTMAY